MANVIINKGEDVHIRSGSNLFVWKSGVDCYGLFWQHIPSGRLSEEFEDFGGNIYGPDGKLLQEEYKGRVHRDRNVYEEWDSDGAWTGFTAQYAHQNAACFTHALQSIAETTANGGLRVHCLQHLRKDSVRILNLIRSKQQDCGGELKESVSSVVWDPILALAAQYHAEDMATNNFMSHTGSDGSDLEGRLLRLNFFANGPGENVAMGQASLEEVMCGWLHSPGHCAVMMTPASRLGVGYAYNPSQENKHYWCMVVADVGPAGDLTEPPYEAPPFVPSYPEEWPNWRDPVPPAQWVAYFSGEQAEERVVIDTPLPLAYGGDQRLVGDVTIPFGVYNFGGSLLLADCERVEVTVPFPPLEDNLAGYNYTLSILDIHKSGTKALLGLTAWSYAKGVYGRPARRMSSVYEATLEIVAGVVQASVAVLKTEEEMGKKDEWVLVDPEINGYGRRVFYAYLPTLTEPGKQLPPDSVGEFSNVYMRYCMFRHRVNTDPLEYEYCMSVSEIWLFDQNVVEVSCRPLTADPDPDEGNPDLTRIWNAWGLSKRLTTHADMADFEFTFNYPGTKVEIDPDSASTFARLEWLRDNHPTKPFALVVQEKQESALYRLEGATVVTAHYNPEYDSEDVESAEVEFVEHNYTMDWTVPETVIEPVISGSFKIGLKFIPLADIDDSPPCHEDGGYVGFWYPPSMGGFGPESMEGLYYFTMTESTVDVEIPQYAATNTYTGEIRLENKRHSMQSHFEHTAAYSIEQHLHRFEPFDYGLDLHTISRQEYTVPSRYPTGSQYVKEVYSGDSSKTLTDLHLNVDQDPPPEGEEAPVACLPTMHFDVHHTWAREMGDYTDHHVQFWAGLAIVGAPWLVANGFENMTTGRVFAEFPMFPRTRTTGYVQASYGPFDSGPHLFAASSTYMVDSNKSYSFDVMHDTFGGNCAHFSAYWGFPHSDEWTQSYRYVSPVLTPNGIRGVEHQEEVPRGDAVVAQYMPPEDMGENPRTIWEACPCGSYNPITNKLVWGVTYPVAWVGPEQESATPWPDVIFGDDQLEELLVPQPDPAPE